MSLSSDQLPVLHQTTKTPLPVMKIFTVMILFLSEAVSITSLFPFVAFMVSDLGVAETQKEIGYYAGYIAAVFTFGQFMTSSLWGSLSDRIGRRPVLLIGLIGNTVCILLFGVSRSFAWALASRTLNGMLNGNDGVIKVYLREVTDSTNQAAAFSYISFCWGFGAIIGPCLGGMLARPVLQYPEWFAADSLFGYYPYLLPCLVSALVSLFGFFFGLVFLDESLVLDSALDNEKLIGDEDSGRFSGCSYDSFKQPSLAEVLSSKPVWLALVTNGLLAMYDIMSNETFMVWAVLPVEEQGLAFSSSQLSYLFIFIGLALLFWQFFVYEHIDAAFGPVIIFQVASFANIFIQSLPGFTNELRTSYPILFWVLILALYFARGCVGASVSTSGAILLNNSTNFHLGAVNGISGSINAISRAIGPVLGGCIMAWSQSEGLPFPLDYHLAFIVVAILVVISLILSLFFPSSMNSRAEISLARKSWSSDDCDIVTDKDPLLKK
eukprot:Nk52_evm2s167 gene=Nk52_evmTU2s167